MNVKLNMLLADDPGLDDFSVCPSPTDDTLCVGACYMATSGAGPDAWKSLKPLTDPYIGPAFSLDEIDAAISKTGAADEFILETGVTPDKVAALLADGKVVARCSGRMEFGQRALGNRSILADPRNAETVGRINHQIKYRDFWMPFAPVILEERLGDYILTPNPIIRRSYMMVGAETTDKGQVELAAAIHDADLTARPQSLNREQNAGCYDIIKAFENLTGTGALLNTSFNLHGEPIACSPEDAISTFQRSALDALLMEDRMLIRK